MVDERFDTPGLLRPSDIESDSRRRRSIGSRWSRCFSPCKENETNRDDSANRASRITTGVGKKRIKRVAPLRDNESSTTDDEQRSPHLTAAASPDNLQWVDGSDDQGMGFGLPRSQYIQNCDDYSEEISDTSENESERSMDLSISDYERKKNEFAKKWSVSVEGGRFNGNRPSGNAMHRVNADLDRYEKGAGVINYKITVRKIMKTDSYLQFSSDLRRPKKSLQATSTPKSSAVKLSWRSSSWKPSSGKRASYRESSLSPRRSVRPRIFPNSVRFSGKVDNQNFSPSRGRPSSLIYSNTRREPPPLSPRPGRRGSSSPPLRRSRSSDSYKVPLRNAHSDGSFRRVTFADDLMGSYKASLTRRQEYIDANVSGRYITGSPPRRSVPQFSNGRRRSQSSNRSYSERQYEEDNESSKYIKNFNDYQAFFAQDINPSESFTEQMRRVRLEGQDAENPFSVWDPDSSRWSRDFEKSLDEFMGPKASSFVKDEDTSSGSLFTDEMEINSRRRLTPRERKLLFHSWNSVFYSNENPGYVKNENITKTSMTDPRYRVFY